MRYCSSMSTPIQNTISRTAHAKVNLALTVDRADPATGLHPICSWVHAIDLGDTVTVERADESSYSVRRQDSGRVDWAVEDDLAVRAHLAIEQASGRSLPVNLTVVKHTPAGGGLGGGSSDAASVLMMVNELYELNLGEAELRAIAGTLGSDVHFFVDPVSFSEERAPRAALVSGFGDLVERRSRESMPITLIMPPFGCSTAAVYSAFDRLSPGPFSAGAVQELAAETIDDTSALFNDLAGPAMEVEPRLGEIHRALTEGLGRAVHVSGSGSTLFVLGRVDADEVMRLSPGVCVIETALV